MAPEAGEADQDDSVDEEESPLVSNGKSGAENGEGGEASEEEDEEDEEPRLKYTPLTEHLKSVYRNGDATSTFLVAGDKMVSRLLVCLSLNQMTDSTQVIGTHNGNIVSFDFESAICAYWLISTACTFCALAQTYSELPRA